MRRQKKVPQTKAHFKEVTLTVTKFFGSQAARFRQVTPPHGSE